jgi:hypothetical protein
VNVALTALAGHLVAELTACQVDGAETAVAPVRARRHDLLASPRGDLDVAADPQWRDSRIVTS